MKKRIVSLVMALLMVCTCLLPAATTKAHAAARFSWYLDEYGIGVSAAQNHEIAMTISIDGTRVMTKIGVQQLYIEQKVNGVWKKYDTLYGADHPGYYEYNSLDFYKTLYFTGKPGVQFRVTLTAFAMDSTGSDTGTVTSYVVTCN